MRKLLYTMFISNNWLTVSLVVKEKLDKTLKSQNMMKLILGSFVLGGKMVELNQIFSLLLIGVDKKQLIRHESHGRPLYHQHQKRFVSWLIVVIHSKWRTKATANARSWICNVPCTSMYKCESECDLDWVTRLMYQPSIMIKDIRVSIIAHFQTEQFPYLRK